MKREEVLKILKEVSEQARTRYKARIEGIFGSFVRGEEQAGSDVDILVEFEEGANLLHLVGVSYFLEEKLGIPVDIVPVDTIRQEIKDRILGEAVYL